MKILIIIPYLLISAFVPWEKFSLSNGLLSNIFFDIGFIFLMIKLFKLQFSYKLNFEKGDLSKILATISLAAGSILCLNSLSIQNPFIYIDWLFFNLVIVGPILEEFIFRGVFSSFYTKKRILQHILSGGVFSLSHSLSMINAPESFYKFFYVQILYTFILGIICSVSFTKSRNILKPILIHIVFNSIFYLVTAFQIY